MKNIIDALEKPQLKGKKQADVSIEDSVDQSDFELQDREASDKSPALTLDWMQFFKKLASLSEDKLSRIVAILDEKEEQTDKASDEEELPDLNNV